MYKLWATILKDLRILLRDKVGLALMFLMPILLVVVVTSIQNSTFELVNKNRLPILICNRDTGKLSKQFIESVDKIGMFKLQELDKSETEQHLKGRMRNKNALLGIIIPADFSTNIGVKAKNVTSKALKSFGLQGDSAGRKVNLNSLDLYYQPVLQESYRVSIEGALRSALQITESRETLRQLYFAINEKPLPAALENELLHNQSTIKEIPVALGGVTNVPNASQHNVPAWTIFAMFFIIISLAGSIIREKRSGSFIRLKTLPTNYLTALISKEVTYLVVTFLQAVVIFSIGLWLFPALNLPPLNMPSNLGTLFFVTLICGLSAVSYAICLGVFAQTEEQANGFGAISIVILAAIGGLMVPSFAMPGSFKPLISISPLHWCLEAYYGLFLEGGKLKDIITDLIPLFVMIIVMQVISYIGLKRKNLI
jgi:ABC-2 type transport system permease protein